MKRGFTLIEMMIALSISAVMLAAVVGLLSSVWFMVKASADELQGALHARSVREQLFYNLTDDSGASLGYGLTSVNDIQFSGPTGFTAYKYEIAGGVTNAVAVWSVDAKDPTDCLRYCLDPDKNKESDYRNGEPLQYLYLKKAYGEKQKVGYVAYHDRLVIPVFGRHPVRKDLDECFIVA